MNPDLVVRDEDGQIYTVRYEAVNAMLLNEFLKEHRESGGTRSDDRQQQKDMAQRLPWPRNSKSRHRKSKSERTA